MTTQRTMNNAEIARVLQDIGDLLELKGENVFKIRAYQRAAKAIEHLSLELEQLMREERLKEVPGIGDAIAKKIRELIETGKLEYYERLRAEFPPGVTELADVPGVGPKTALKLAQELGISTVEELEAAIDDGKVAALYRLGDKTADNIKRHIQTLRTKERRILLGEALPRFEEIAAQLQAMDAGIQNLTAAGSLRRLKETIGDIDIMGTADDAEAAIARFVALPGVKEVLGRGPTKASVIMGAALQVDLRVVPHDSFGSLLQYFTGSKEHNIILRGFAERKGLKVSEYGITDLATGELEKFETEEDFYARLGLQYVPPELREARGEVELAAANGLPDLVSLDDIRGDLHIHSKSSDGRETIEELAVAARERGYEYIAITDHPGGRGGRQFTADDLRRQIEEIAELNGRIEGIRVLSGVEVDIRADGSLDVPDDLLAELDVVVASVHSSMEQDRERMTRRVLGAMENPHVDIIGHPTCRLLQEREPVDLDLTAVFQAALDTRTALEINCMPDRLDLNDVLAYRARALGVPLVVSTDAHHVRHLDFMRYGVAVARRAWCESRDIINTKSLPQLLEFLRRG